MYTIAELLVELLEHIYGELGWGDSLDTCMSLLHAYLPQLPTVVDDRWLRERGGMQHAYHINIKSLLSKELLIGAVGIHVPIA